MATARYEKNPSGAFTPAAPSLRPKKAAALLGIGVSTLWRWAAEKPDFPQPIRLSTRCTVWASDALIAWRDAQAFSKAP